MAILYARLDVKDRQKIMWDHPWTPEEVNGRPWIGAVGEQELDLVILKGI